MHRIQQRLAGCVKPACFPSVHTARCQTRHQMGEGVSGPDNGVPASPMPVSHVSRVPRAFSSHRDLLPRTEYSRTTRGKDPGYLDHHLKVSCGLQVTPLLKHLTPTVLTHYDWEKGWSPLLQLALIKLILGTTGKVPWCCRKRRRN